jgi:hypothetical protein
MNKFVAARRYADPEIAARKPMEIANGLGEVWDGRLFIEWSLVRIQAGEPTKSISWPLPSSNLDTYFLLGPHAFWRALSTAMSQ